MQTVTINSSSPAFTFTPATGYHIADVLIDGVSNPGAVTAGTYTFTNVTANHTIAVSFAINTFTITPTAGANGTITPGTPQTVNYGGILAFAITPNAGYHVARRARRRRVGRPCDLLPVHQRDRQSHDLGDVRGRPAGAITAPTTSATWLAGTSQPVSWHLNAAVGTGTFYVWAVNQTTGTWYDVTSQAAVAGRVDHTANWAVNAPPGDYRLTLWYISATSPFVNLDYGTAVMTVASAVTGAFTAPIGTATWPIASIRP